MSKSKRTPSPQPSPPVGAREKRGRPQVITAAVVERVAEAMSLGVPEEYACLLHGVNPATFGPAVSRNEKFKAIKKRWDAQFMVRACKAIADGGEMGTMTDAEGLERQVRKPWQGLAWLLERRHKPHWNRVDQHALSQADGSAVLSEQDMVELERLVKARVLGGK